MALARIHHMKRIFPLLILSAPLAFAADPTVVLTPLRGHLYVVEDNFYFKENSMVYVGDSFVTVVGATWTPETAKLLAPELKKVPPKPLPKGFAPNSRPQRPPGMHSLKGLVPKIISPNRPRVCFVNHG